MTDKPEILLSVLIPSIHERRAKLLRLLNILERQNDPGLEVIVSIDNRGETPLGSKRNDMMQRAAGKYLCHIDDDELVSADFFAALKPELQYDADAIGYNASVILNGARPFTVRTIFGAENGQPQHVLGGYSDIVRNFWHWCAWRTTLARQFSFPDHAGDEDWQWLRQVYPHVKSHRKLERTLFTHIFDANESTFPVN